MNEPEELLLVLLWSPPYSLDDGKDDGAFPFMTSKFVSLGTAPHMTTFTFDDFIDSDNRFACCKDPTLLNTTPAIESSVSNSWYPLVTAAIDRAIESQSHTNITGAFSHFAICAVEPFSEFGSYPSNNPSRPSTMATSHSLENLATVDMLYSFVNMIPSKECDGRLIARSCLKGSLKSGPTLNACTRNPLCSKAAMRPMARVVLPTPAEVPLMTIIFILPRFTFFFFFFFFFYLHDDV